MCLLFFCEKKMGKLNLYRLDNDYIEHLRTYDSGVYQNKDGRPYVGILVQIGSQCYFAPMTSPKPKHKKMRNSIDFLKIENGKHGAINLGRMVPAAPELASMIQIDEEEGAYAKLLENQLHWIRDNQKRIVRSAKKLYYLLTQKNETELYPYEASIRNRACDVLALEAALQEYLQASQAEAESNRETGATEGGDNE